MAIFRYKYFKYYLSKIMINYLYDVSGNLPIAMLPSVINHNNNAINEQFDWIFDSSNNRLTKSVYAPTGSVKSHFGEFVNLSVEYINIKNIDSLSDSIADSISNLKVSHKNLTDTGVDGLDGLDSKYLHDASHIYCSCFNNSVEYALTILNSKIEDLSTNLSNINNNMSMSIPSNDFNNKDSMVYAASVVNTEYDTQQENKEPITYSKSLLYATPLQLKRQKLPKLHYNDIINGKLYTYYTITTNNVSIDNKNIAAIENSQVGQIINIKFNNITNKDFKILLNRVTNTYLKMSINPLNILQLKCISADTINGDKWELYNYCVTSPNDIAIENLNNN